MRFIVPTIVLAGIGLAVGCIVSGFRSSPAVLPGLDRSFFVQPDMHAWPGNMLSEEQFDSAVKNFARVDSCDRTIWALIGPEFFLLEGTDYNIRLSDQSVMVFNGYWGDPVYRPQTLGVAQLAAEKMNRNRCLYGERAP